MKTGHEGLAREASSIRSLSDEEDPKERKVAECQEENAMCEWSHIHEESEWSLMISLIRRLGFP